MAMYTRRSAYTQHSIQIMMLLPGNRFLLTRNGPNDLWEVSHNMLVSGFHGPPGVAARRELVNLYSFNLAGTGYSLIPMPSVTSTLGISDKEIKVFLVTITEMFSFCSGRKKEFKTGTLDEIVDTVLQEGGSRGTSNIFSGTTMTVLRNLGDSDLIWQKKLTNIWGKRSSLQV